MSGFSLWSRQRNTSIIYGSRVLTSINYGSNTWMLKSVDFYIQTFPFLRLLCQVACEVPQGGTALRVANPQCGVREFWPKLLLLPSLPKLIYVQMTLSMPTKILRKGAIKEDKTGSHIREYMNIYSFGLEQYIFFDPWYLSFINFNIYITLTTANLDQLAPPFFPFRFFI